MQQFDPFESIVSLCSNEDDQDRDSFPSLNVHASLLTSCSERLENLVRAARPVARNTKELRLDLPYQGLCLLASWLYGSTLFSSSITWSSDDSLRSLLLGYETGEQLHIVRFMDFVADRILTLLEQEDNLAMIEKGMPYLIKHTKANSNLRKLFVDQIVMGKYKWNPEEGSNFAPFTANANFSAMLLKKFMKRKSEQSVHLYEVGMPQKLNACVYHKHPEIQRPCYRTHTGSEKIQEEEMRVRGPRRRDEDVHDVDFADNSS